MANLITSMVCTSRGVDILSLFRFFVAGYVCSYWYAHQISVFTEKVGEYVAVWRYHCSDGCDRCPLTVACRQPHRLFCKAVFLQGIPFLFTATKYI